MQIEIHLPRPGLTLLALAAVSGWALYLQSGTAQTASVVEAPAIQHDHGDHDASLAPSPSPLAAAIIPAISDQEDSGLTPAEMRIKWMRAEQEFLRLKQDIIREQLAGLQKQRELLGPVIDPALEDEFRRSVQLLTSLVKDEQKAEQFLLTSYRQQWKAEEDAMAAASSRSLGIVALSWPVEPAIGISAYFLDPGYKQRFKVDHYAIDIPITQGTTVLAAQGGIVKDVVDHGLGYNYVTIDHGGYSTVYGHLSQFTVRPGQRVRVGDPVGKSGGTPGLPGGGLSTGPHLHFGLYVKGVPVDPLRYLPKWNG